ncbi:hypothetical protein [Azospirillum sp. sgz301742]
MDENEKHEKLLIRVGIVAAGFSAFFWGLYLFRWGLSFGVKRDEWGQAGDFIGGTLNPFFALLSFIALLYMISLQRRELSYTRSELQQSREIAKQQVDHFKKEAFRAELVKVMETLEKDLEEYCDKKTIASREEINVHLGEARRNLDAAQAQYAPYVPSPGSIDWKAVKAAECLEQIDAYLSHYRNASNGNSPVEHYYRHKYGNLALSLVHHNFLNRAAVRRLVRDANEIAREAARESLSGEVSDN